MDNRCLYDFIGHLCEKPFSGMPMKLQTAYKLLFTEYPNVINVDKMCEMLASICDKIAYKLLKSSKIKNFIVGHRYQIPNLNILEYLEFIDKHTAQNLVCIFGL